MQVKLADMTRSATVRLAGRTTKIAYGTAYGTEMDICDFGKGSS